MTNKYQNKYRIPSARLQNWDYGWNASYFVTICTQNKECYFGDIVDGKMQLSEIGEMAQKYWHEIPEHFPLIKLNAFVIMPNHVHGIIVMDKPVDGRDDVDVDGHVDIETQNLASLQEKPKPINKFCPQSKNLGSIIRGFKIGVTKNAREIDANFAWQSRFHDHIIRNDESFEKIKSYIIENPLKWNDDKFNNK